MCRASCCPEPQSIHQIRKKTQWKRSPRWQLSLRVFVCFHAWERGRALVSWSVRELHSYTYNVHRWNAFSRSRLLVVISHPTQSRRFGDTVCIFIWHPTQISFLRNLFWMCVWRSITVEWKSYLAHLLPSAVKSEQIWAKSSRIQYPQGPAQLDYVHLGSCTHQMCVLQGKGIYMI